MKAHAFTIPKKTRKDIIIKIIYTLKKHGFFNFATDKNRLDYLKCSKNNQHYIVLLSAHKKKSVINNASYLDFKFRIRKKFNKSYIQMESYEKHAFSKDNVILQKTLTTEDNIIKKTINKIRTHLYLKQFVTMR